MTSRPCAAPVAITLGPATAEAAEARPLFKPIDRIARPRS